MTDYLDRAIRAQPCTLMAGEWVRHAYSGVVGLVMEDLGRKVRVEVNGFLGCLLLTWDKKGVLMVAEPGNYFDEQGTLRNADGSRSIFDDVDE